MEEVQKMSNNLDAELNKLGFEIVDEIDKQKDKKLRKNLINHIDKALGVLANDGVYAYYVFCLSKDKDDNNENSKKPYREIFVQKVKDKLLMFLPTNYKDKIDLQDFFEELSGELHDLLFFKDALERALIYARYHAKALGDKDE